MNNDESNQGQQDGKQADVEARIVAWVMGEASAAESAELESLVAAQPELAAFRAAIMELRGLSKEAMAADRVPLRLSQGRRSALLHRLGTPAEEIPNLVALKRQHQMNRRWMLALAACITLGLFLSATIPSFQKVRTLSKEEREGNGLKMEAEEKAKSANLQVALPVITPETDSADDVQTFFAAAAPRAVEQRVAGVSAEPAAAVLNNARQLAVAPQYKARDIGAIAVSNKQEAKTNSGGQDGDVEKEAPIALSPFVVDASEDKGSYR
ncbi:MAG TPA: hypothetical protein VIJ19_11790, partial [Opitutaceae bacterium]